MTLLDENRELVSFAHGQHWTPDAAQSSAPVYTQIDASNVFVAVDLALVLQKRGDEAKVKVLLDGAMQSIGKLTQFARGITDVQIHALRGDKAKALAALRIAERAGWRWDWRYHREFDPTIASIRNEPEFKAVFADIERDMALQRAKLAKLPKDAPLDLAGD